MKCLDFFYKSNKKKSGYKSCCKQYIFDDNRLNNVSEKRQGYREANREYTYNYNKKYYSKNKIEIKK